MNLTPEEILKVKTKNTVRIVSDTPLYKAVISAMKYFAKQEVEKERDRIMERLTEMVNKESIEFLDDFIIDLMNDGKDRIKELEKENDE